MPANWDSTPTLTTSNVALALLLFCAVFFWSSTGISDIGYEIKGSATWPRITIGVFTGLLPGAGRWAA